jgi:3-hydroxyisobutyrate dehydrogenase-like beta-hydroxyacid dehydrogenase
MTLPVIAILMPGDMGHGVGAALSDAGHTVLTCLAGRSEATRTLATRAGMQDTETLVKLVERADVILSILPPSAAISLATEIAAAMREAGKTPVYVDCNAISPATARAAADAISAAGAVFIDAGIIGLAPGKGGGTRFYVSGADVSSMLALDGKGFEVISLGAEVGRASAMKMVYAALTKGTWTLQTAVMLAAEKLGLTEELTAEFAFSQKPALDAMRARIPRLPADSGRWIGEMEEIAATFADAGVTSGFHDGAADIFRVLAQTPFAAETRETIDASRTMEEALKVYAQIDMKKD